MKRLITVMACAAVTLSVAATGAFAGEVKGPPTGGTPSTDYTAARTQANSLCAFSGLNDYVNGQNDRQTQTPKDAAPGSAAHGWEVVPGVIISCNPNGVVG